MIVTRMGGMPEIIKDCGLTFEPDGLKDLMEAVQKLWGDEELCSSFGSNAYRRCLEKYSEDKVYKKIENAYEHALH